MTTSPRTRWSRLPRYTLPGCWVALLFACLSFTPSLLPRPALFQGLVTGIDAAIGYGVGVAGAWLWREFADRPARRPSRRAWAVFAALAPALLVTFLVLGQLWYRAAAELVSVEPASPATALLVPLVAVPVFVVLVAAARGARRVYSAVTTYLARHMGLRAARALGLVVLGVTAALVLSGVVWDTAVRVADQSFSLTNDATPPGVSRPTTPLRSGSEESLVEWGSLGAEGRVFVGRGPSAADIRAVTGRPALDPVRVYAGLESATSTEDRAALAVRDLERAGGFARRRLLVVTTTGTGWVEPSSVGSFEYLGNGDTATVSMQYSYLPSWLSFLVDQDRARETGRELFDAVYGRWSRLAPRDRPELFVFGESLGSFGGETAFSGEHDLANRTSGALFVGPPNFNPLYRELVEDRDPGSAEIEPVYRDGRTIRFAGSASGLDSSDGPWRRPRVLYLQHASDPITWWSTDLLLRRPDWLEEPRGDDVLSSMRWMPVVTFWQVSADLALGFSTEPGHGHNYTGEHVRGWYSVVRPSGWSEEQLDRLRELARAEEFSQPYDGG